MRPAVVVLGAVALAVAGSTGLLLSRYIDRAEAEVEAVMPKIKTVRVLVAADGLTIGRVVTRDDLAWQEWPEPAARSAAAQGVVLASDAHALKEASAEFEGAVIRAPIVKGEPLTAEKVTRPKDSSLLAAVLSPGMRSITLSVDITASAGGLLQPGDRVDIMLTTDLPDPHAGQVNPQTGQQAPRFVTETILRNMKVLTVDRSLEGNATPDAPIPTNVTLEGTPRQAEQVATALRIGRLTLTLRPLRIGGPKPEKGFPITTDLQVMRSLHAVRAGVEPGVLEEVNPFAPLAGAASGKVVDQVTIYRWTQPSTVGMGRVPTAGTPLTDQPEQGFQQ